MSDPVEQVRKLLAKMDGPQLVEVQNHCSAFRMLSSSARKGAEPETGKRVPLPPPGDPNEEALHESIRRTLTTRLGCQQLRYAQFRNTKFYSEFSLGAKHVIDFWSRQQVPLTVTQRRGLMVVSGALVVWHLEERQKPFLWTVVSATLQQFEHVVNQYFPGYLAAGPDVLFILTNRLLGFKQSQGEDNVR